MSDFFLPWAAILGVGVMLFLIGLVAVWRERKAASHQAPPARK